MPLSVQDYRALTAHEHRGNAVRSAKEDKLKASENAVDKEKTVKPNERRAQPQSGEEGQIGNALRAVYREAVNEQVPDEMLDLLKKLD